MIAFMLNDLRKMYHELGNCQVRCRTWIDTVVIWRLDGCAWSTCLDNLVLIYVDWMPGGQDILAWPRIGITVFDLKCTVDELLMFLGGQICFIQFGLVFYSWSRKYWWGYIPDVVNYLSVLQQHNHVPRRFRDHDRAVCRGAIRMCIRSVAMSYMTWKILCACRIVLSL